ncbi:hypothetical protein QEH44_gp44 [Arthrobacter phage Shambre1]|uniref:Uncharacterized protein n=1 Tax=Arthrobacter phage Shambre1 TaxID=2927284 RepID=A0A977PSE5_9CAUD|nr:hypothetical protein QEH44_gp44 [Arthrobacter phage Shambre1]UXE04780.1 hypothetical protein SEA_SHAMBRE1_44 [Arthrobacter phage Shambre1]
MTRKAPAAKEAPLENVKPKVGLRVRLAGEPGQWQVTAKAPHGADWWCSPVDDEARAARKLPPPLGSYRQASYRDMRPHNFKGEF